MAVNITQSTQHQVIQRIEFVKEKSNINAISWSNDNKLAVGTNGGVTIVNITGVNHCDKKKGPKLKFSRSLIAADTKIENDLMEQTFFSSEELIPMFVDSPCHSTALTDSALCPNILKHTGLLDVLFAKWSPTGCDRIGRCVLAVLFRTNKLCLYVSEKNADKFQEIVNLTRMHCAQLKAENYFKENLNMRGKIPADPRKKLGDATIWEDFQEWQTCKYLLNFTSIEWCPLPIICPNAIKKTKSKFVFLATVVKNGNLFIWQGLLPLMGHSVQRVLAAHTSLFYPCSLAWSSVTPDGTSYLACGNTAGQIKVFFIKISSTVTGLPRMTIVKAYTFLGNQDDRNVDCLTWHFKGSSLFLACSKGPEVSVFRTQLMKGGALSKPIQEIVNGGVHLLNVTALTVSPTGTLYSTSGEGAVQQLKLGTQEKSTVFEYDSSSEFGCVGVAISPNGVFLALWESRRKLFLERHKALPDPYCQIAIISLVTKEENHQNLMAWTSHPVGLSLLWDRFYFQEMFGQKLSESLIFPESLNSFSQSFLQFLRNLVISNSTWNPPGSIDQNVNNIVPEQQNLNENTATDVTATSDTKSLSTQKLDMIKKIEKHLVVLVMQEILKAFLECRIKLGNNLEVKLLGQEPLLFVICRWLAENSPLTSVTKLLEKVWFSFFCPVRLDSKPIAHDQMVVDMNSASSSDESNSQEFSEIRQKFLQTENVVEKCLCGKPITFQEFRIARCVVGHVWPRCCVTFKILDGTNCRVCVNCTAHALIQNPQSVSKLDWTKSLVEGNFSCSFCGGWFQFVR